MTNEERRLQEAKQPTTPWKKWGPYLSERQWGLDPTTRCERDGAELATRGLYLDLPGWRPIVFALTPAER